MFRGLFQVICRTGIFMICAQAIVHFRPQESYEKYLKLLVSVMVLIQLFLPLGSLFTGAGSQDAARELEAFRESLEQGMEEARQQAEETDARLQEMTLQEVRRRMEEQAAAEAEMEDEDPPGGEEPAQPADISVELQDIAVEVGPIEKGGAQGK